MKSLLVDVLREAKKGSSDQTLSDSGSFDTTQHEIPDTANDAVICQDDEAGEALELYESTASLDSASRAESDADFSESLELLLDNTEVDPVSGPLSPATTVTIANVHSNAPRLAQYAPLVCIALAAIASASWVGYQQLKLKYAESQFAMAQMGSAGANVSGADRSGAAQSTERFPFIEAGAPVGEGERVE